MSSDDANLDDAVSDFVRNLGGKVMTGYVTYVEYLDEDGDFSYCFTQADGQSATTSLGQAEALRMIVRHSMTSMLDDDE